jgi:hypothetical protein
MIKHLISEVWALAFWALTLASSSRYLGWSRVNQLYLEAYFDFDIKIHMGYCLLSIDCVRGVVGVLPSASLDEAYFAFHANELTGYSVLCILQAVLQISLRTGRSDDVLWNQCLINRHRINTLRGL